MNLIKAHPIFVDENNWIIAEDIEKEDELLILKGEKLLLLKVNSVSIVKKNTYTYNINIENNNFLITKSNVLVIGIRQLEEKLNDE